MARQMLFIGRNDELAQIEKSVREWGTRKVLFIYGSGGVGKTRLLEEVHKRYLSNKDLPLLIGKNIIDFDDHIFYIPENLAGRIAQVLDKSIFEPYLHELLNWRKMERAKVSPESLNQQRERARQAFVDSFNQLEAKQRIVLFLDTTDTLAGTRAWSYITDLICQSKNSLFILAGRNAKALWESLHSRLGQDTELIELQPLKAEEGKAYLAQKQRQLHIPLEPNLMKKLLLLGQGLPILIDLAVEWLSRDIPMKWLIESNVQELEALSPDLMKQRQKDFEAQLVSHITQIRTPMDRVILAIAHIYPLNVGMLVELLHISEDEAKGLFEEAQTYVFVKPLPDGKISLHDEMRRMVNEHVWPEVDPDGSRQRRYSTLVIEHLAREIQALVKRIDQLKEREKVEHHEVNAQTELDIFITHETLERELWALKEKQLHHILFVDIDRGIKTFAEMFDEVTSASRFSQQEALLVQVQQYADLFSPEQVYEVDSRRVKHLLDRAEYLPAKDLATEILGRGIILPEQQIDMLLQRGNVEIRLGHLEQGISDFEHAIRVSQIYNFQSLLMRGLNERGWAYRNKGLFDLALADYLEAYQISLQLDDLQQAASIKTNMSYVKNLLGDQQGALGDCQEALRLWEKLKIDRGKGRAHSTLGELYRRDNQLAEAMSHYTQALDIFIRENDVEWISKVRSQRAIAFLAEKKLDEAEGDLHWALANAPLNEHPRILHYIAEVYWVKGDLKNARKSYEESREIAQQIGDTAYDYRSYSDLIDLVWEFSEYNRWQELYEEYQKLYAHKKDVESLKVHGSTLRKIGDLAICDNNYKAALALYKEGFLLKALYETHKGYTVNEQLKITESRLIQISSRTMLKKLGKDLAKFWKSKNFLTEKSPETLLILEQWGQTEKTL